jgi:excisionase family DNA binding protein
MPNTKIENLRLNTREAARYLNLGFSTIAKMRLYGGGPRYYKIGSKVIYDTADLDAWLASKRQAHTSQNRAA